MPAPVTARNYSGHLATNAWPGAIIAIVDPAFSLTLLLAIILALRYGKPRLAQAGLGFAGLYLLFGLWQHLNAYDAASELAQQRGHQVERMMVKPTMANLLLWRSVYESDGVFYVDAVRVGLFGDERIYQGGQAPRFKLERDMPQLNPSAALYHDIERFRYFSDDYVIADLVRENVLIDARYSMLPTGLAPIWGIDMNVDSEDQHAQFIHYRDRAGFSRERFVAMLLGREL